MTRLLLFSLLFLINISWSFAQGILYKTITTPLTGQRNISYNFQNKQGLTVLDKQLILDMHNTLRAHIATGKETRGYNSDKQPTAANMQALVRKTDHDYDKIKCNLINTKKKIFGMYL